MPEHLIPQSFLSGLLVSFSLTSTGITISDNCDVQLPPVFFLTNTLWIDRAQSEFQASSKTNSENRASKKATSSSNTDNSLGIGLWGSSKPILYPLVATRVPATIVVRLLVLKVTTELGDGRLK